MAKQCPLRECHLLCTVPHKHIYDKAGQFVGSQMTQSPDPRDERIAELQRERDAYKRAKEENDERYMIERDEARARVKELEGMERRARTYEAANTKLIAERDAALARVQELERVASIRAGELHRVLGEKLALQADRDRWKDQARERETACLAALNEVERLKKCAKVTDESWRQLQADNARLREALEDIMDDCSSGLPAPEHYCFEEMKSGPCPTCETWKRARQALHSEEAKKPGASEQALEAHSPVTNADAPAPPDMSTKQEKSDTLAGHGDAGDITPEQVQRLEEAARKAAAEQGFSDSDDGYTSASNEGLAFVAGAMWALRDSGWRG